MKAMVARSSKPFEICVARGASVRWPDETPRCRPAGELLNSSVVRAAKREGSVSTRSMSSFACRATSASVVARRSSHIAGCRSTRNPPTMTKPTPAKRKIAPRRIRLGPCSSCHAAVESRPPNLYLSCRTAAMFPIGAPWNRLDFSRLIREVWVRRRITERSGGRDCRRRYLDGEVCPRR